MKAAHAIYATCALLLSVLTPVVDAHAAHGAHAAQATTGAASGVNDDKHCPLCNMWVKDENMTWFTELKNGQRIYTCGMTNGTQYQLGSKYFSHPSLVGATLGSLVVPDGTGCNATCPECDDPTTPVRDPITGTKISSAKFTYLCLKKGQKIYFESDTTKQTFLSGAQSKAYFGVASNTCNSTECPDSMQDVPVTAAAATPSPTSLRGSDGTSPASTSNEPFCSGSSAMFSGFQTTVHGTCVKLLFQPLVLNSAAKYAIGFIGVFLLPLFNEYLVYVRERLRQSFRKAASSGATPAMRHRNKIVLTLLYMAQMTIAYFAMLVVMIYDTGLFVALIAGFGFGYVWFKSGKDVKVSAARASGGTSAASSAVGDGVVAAWRFQQFDALTVLHVSGMKCMANCGSTVQTALENTPGVDHVYVDMTDKCVYVAGSTPAPLLVDAVDSVGFEAVVLRTPPEDKHA
ncbi:Aste57867_18290 [Aphanomyces stellatus]|uniref:Copper transport protein n=1 Tax=Aphanomyces stellatus TaxID=120398 RepID=A0A485LDF0_9STRA|nr:hypothetical protein As57867_018228 [Aphanomyces stellatus]VFT95027.1 Aste57867_18290 [Aphanomyces stellatus]